MVVIVLDIGSIRRPKHKGEAADSRVVIGFNERNFVTLALVEVDGQCVIIHSPVKEICGNSEAQHFQRGKRKDDDDALACVDIGGI